MRHGFKIDAILVTYFVRGNVLNAQIIAGYFFSKTKNI